jgi:hypothetical protein
MAEAETQPAERVQTRRDRTVAARRTDDEALLAAGKGWVLATARGTPREHAREHPDATRDGRSGR